MSLTTLGRTDQDLRERLSDIRGQIAEARQERAEAVQNRDATKEAFANAQHDGRVTDWPEFRQAQEAVARIGAIDERLEDLRGQESEILNELGGAVPGFDREMSFLNDPAIRGQLEQMAHTQMPIGRLDLGISLSRDAIVERFGRMAAVGDTDVPSGPRVKLTGEAGRHVERDRLLLL